MLKTIWLIVTTAICHFSSFAQKQQPNKTELFQYLQTKFRAFTWSSIDGDGSAYVEKWTYDENNCSFFFSSKPLTDGTKSLYEVNFSNLDANAIAWDIVTINFGEMIKEEWLELRLISKNKKPAWNAYSSNEPRPKSYQSDDWEIRFDLSKVANAPDFQDQISLALAKLIKLCGGTQTFNPVEIATSKEKQFAYLRAKLFALSPHEYIVDHLINEVSYDEIKGTLAIQCSATNEQDELYGIHLRVIDFSNLDANGVVWEIVDFPKGKKSLRLKLLGKNGKSAWQVFDKDDMSPVEISEGSPAYLLFDVAMAADIPNFQNNMDRLIKNLIRLCGGKKEEKF